MRKAIIYLVNIEDIVYPKIVTLLTVSLTHTHTKVDLLVCAVEGERVAREVDDILAQVELLVHVPHGGLVGVHTVQGFGVVLVKVAHKA